ncbi:MAG: ammonium transporter [Planctomycetes bacterium]|nr:ammonium transporter [Planctomycetota bacterium]
MDNELSALTVIFTEFYYWVTVVFMFLIHVGFCLYEVSVSRRKNMVHTLMKNAMIVPLVTVTFFFFGWWLYFAFQNGPGITGGLKSAPWSEPWSELMGPHMGGKPAGDPELDTATWARLNGVFWAAFLLFSWTAASVLSGAVIERIRSGAFWIFAVFVGSVTWVIDAAWGWSDTGWMVQKLGYHDAYASGVIHAVAGGSALAILSQLGPRVGRFRADGTPRNFPLQNPWLAVIGLFLIYAGFWGFYAACNVPIIDVDTDEGRTFFSATTIYLTPTTLSAITFNFLTALAGGMLTGYFLSKGEAFWTFSGGLGGIIAASAGNDLYHPLQAFLIAVLGVAAAYRLHYWVERKFKIDDAVVAVAVHGYCGTIGVIVAGFVLWGYPSSPDPSFAKITPWGQTAGAVIMFGLLGFLPCFILAKILKSFGLLRIPLEVEVAGLDHPVHKEEADQVRELIAAEREEFRAASR